MRARILQIRIYIGKCQRAFINEKGWKNLISTLLIMLLIVSVLPSEMFVEYGPTRNGCFALICAGVWIGVFNSIQSICRERDIIKREHMSGLHMSSYIAAHMIYELMLCLAEALIMTAVIRISSQYFPSEGVSMPALIEMYISLLLLIYCSDILGIMISCIVHTPNTAMTVMPFVLIIELIMCGYIFELSGFSEKLSYLTISKWSLNALCTIANVNDMENYIPKFAPDYMHETGHLQQMWGILLAFVLLYGIIATISLEFIDRDKR